LIYNISSAYFACENSCAKPIVSVLETNEMVSFGFQFHESRDDLQDFFTYGIHGLNFWGVMG